MEHWVIRKRGYFYRPDRAGYTSSAHEAGRYTREEAEAEARIEASITAHPLSEFLSTKQIGHEMVYTVWVLLHPTHGMWYSPPATNAADAWAAAVRWEQFLQGGACIIGWKDEMKAAGWRARQVKVTQGEDNAE